MEKGPVMHRIQINIDYFPNSHYATDMETMENLPSTAKEVVQTLKTYVMEFTPWRLPGPHISYTVQHIVAEGKNAITTDSQGPVPPTTSER